MIGKAGLMIIPLAALVCSPALGGEHGHGEPVKPSLIRRMEPVGGWHPDEGGLFRWWNPRCFRTPCGPDDYCRKPLPIVCRPLPQAGRK